MKKNVIRALLVVSMLAATRVSAEGDAPAPAPAAAPAVVTEAAPTGTDASATAALSDAETTTTAPGASFVSSLWKTALSPVNWTKDNFWDKYPHAAGATATVVGFWAMYKFCPWFREEVLGCTKTRKGEEALF